MVGNWHLRRMGNKARDLKDWFGAVKYYKEYLARVPSDFAIWVQLGHALKESGDLTASRTAYAKARELNPSDADLLLNTARLLKIQGDIKGALELFQQSYRLDGNRHARAEINSLYGEPAGSIQEGIAPYPIDDIMRKVLDSGYFDPYWYQRKYPDIGIQPPLRHFCETGVFEWRSPGPHFDTEWYLLQNPDLIAHVNARALNPLLHFIDHGLAEGRAPVMPLGMLATAKTTIDGIFDIDPDIYTVQFFLDERNLKSLPVRGGPPKDRAYQAFKNIHRQLQKHYDYVVTVPWLSHGGADLVSTHLCRAISQLAGRHSVLLLVVDYRRIDGSDWLPDGVDMLILQDSREPLSTSELSESLSYLLQAMRPKAIINVNSEACWQLFKLKAKALSQQMRLFGCAFCRDFSADGRASGYADTHFREPLPWLTGLISDNSQFFDTLSQHFGVPHSFKKKFIVLYNPAPKIKLPPAAQEARTLSPGKLKARFKVLWASRIVRQKNIELLKRIVESAPDIHFDIWGRGEQDAAIRQWASALDNVEIKGSYAGFSRLPLREYGAFLYTSLWDGIPNVLLEAASAQLPIIAPAVGGIGELIDDSTGWLVRQANDVEAYTTALRDVRDDIVGRELRVRRLEGRLEEQHSWEKFLATLKQHSIVELCHEK